MESNNSFNEYISQEKKNRITNLPNHIEDKRDDGNFLAFFERNGINMSSVRSYLDQAYKGKMSKKKREGLIEGTVTNLSLNEGKEQIISAILEKGPFDSPDDLAQTIAEYIKSKLSYDALSALFQAAELETTLDTQYKTKIPDKTVASIFIILKGDGIYLSDIDRISLIMANENGCFTDKILSILVDYFKKNKKIRLNVRHIKLFTSLLNKLKKQVSIDTLPKIYQLYINKIDGFVSDNNLQGLEKFLYSQFGNDKDFRTFIVGLFREGGYTDLFSTLNITNIQDMLNEVRTGVCRHYSVMMREIYNEILKNGKGLNFSGDSEMLFVLNSGVSHAYNILIMDSDDGNIKKQYLDVTSFILGKDLFIKSDDILNIKGETWVNNDSNKIESFYS